MKLTAIVLVAFVGIITGMLSGYDADMRLDPQDGWPQLDEVFTVEVLLEAKTPVNAFQGDIIFDSEYLTVDSIDYNDSLADLWAVEPWYSNGAGTINFAGGVTKPGGFTGVDSVVSINFKTKKVGNAKVRFQKINILLHDGLGTDALVPDSIDALFAVTDSSDEFAVSKSGNKYNVYVLPGGSPTDLDGDGKQGVGDVSIFLTDMVTQNPRSDFNQDGIVSVGDLSVLLTAN